MSLFSDLVATDAPYRGLRVLQSVPPWTRWTILVALVVSFLAAGLWYSFKIISQHDWHTNASDVEREDLERERQSWPGPPS